jgi:predicted transglutaminase-like cysteine proteinase
VGRRGPLLRPFCQRAQVHTRGYSTLLQRVLTDFGAETAFGQIPVRVREHYGIDLPATSARHITLHHAHQVDALAPAAPDAATAMVIVECDGSMIPIVENEPPPAADAVSAPDRRRHKTLLWKEVRLCAAQAQGRVHARYAATLGSVLEAGLAWEQVAQRAGFATGSRVHGVGDGAPWIAEQFALRFGAQGRYVVDFYHVSDYLAAAAPHCGGAHPTDWRRQQQQALRENRADEVLAALATHVEPAEQAASRSREGESRTPVRDCQRYVSERREQLDYAGALAAGLPIGSGLIESGHRHVVQARLKRSGAWWKLNNARDMVGLRVLRANHDWETYWRAFPHHLNN